MICSNCHAHVIPDARFCAGCGMRCGTPGATAHEEYASHDVNARTRAEAVVRHSSVGVMILLSMVTFGFYQPYWWLSRRREINALHSDEQIEASPFITGIVVLAIGRLFWLMATLAALGDQGGDPSVQLGIALFHGADSLASLATLVILTVQAFKVRRMFQQHTGSDDVSPWLTFFFSTFYLQYKFNQVRSGSSRSSYIHGRDLRRQASDVRPSAV